MSGLNRLLAIDPESTGVRDVVLLLRAPEIVAVAWRAIAGYTPRIGVGWPSTLDAIRGG